MNQIENIGLIIGCCFMSLSLSLLGWSFTGLFTDKRWKKMAIFSILVILSMFLYIIIMNTSTESFNFKN